MKSYEILPTPTPTPAPEHPLGGHERTWGTQVAGTAPDIYLIASVETIGFWAFFGMFW